MDVQEDALTMGARLKAQAKADAKERGRRALHEQGSVYPVGVTARQRLAEEMYKSAYDGIWTACDSRPAEDVLNRFCREVWNCSYQEILDALDMELGMGHAAALAAEGRWGAKE